MATVKYPIEYTLHPTRLAKGEQWVWLDLRNVSEEPITELTVRLISQDASRIQMKEPDSFVPSLPPGEEEQVGFEVDAVASTGTYPLLAGDWDGAPFHWESPYIQLIVGEAVAEVASLVTMGPPYPPPEEPVSIEAIVRAFGRAENLRLELWADTPSGAFERLARIEIGELQTGDAPQYSAALTPQEKGTHTIYAYLYEGEERIDRRMRPIYVS